MKLRLLLVALVASCASDPAPSQSGFGLGESIPEYNRDDWGRWMDADKDCQDTRQEVLIAESTVPVTFTDEKHCRVAKGRWVDPYTGEIFDDPSAMEIDHTVALREVHYAGGWAWPPEKKRAYYNDLSNPHHLVAAGVSANRSKGARAPDTWMPPDPKSRCAYIVRRLSVFLAWQIEFDRAAAIEQLLKECK